MNVGYTDGRKVKVRIGPKAEVAFERHFQISMSQAAKDISAEKLYFLAWAALHHAGKEALDFDSFLDVLEDVDMDTSEESSVGPTGPDQPLDQ